MGVNKMDIKTEKIIKPLLNCKHPVVYIPCQSSCETSCLQSAPAHASWQQLWCLVNGPYRGSSFTLAFMSTQVNMLDIVTLDLCQRLRCRLTLSLSYTHQCGLTPTTTSAVLGETIISKPLTAGSCTFLPTAPIRLFVSARKAMKTLTLWSSGNRGAGSLLSRPLWVWKGWLWSYPKTPSQSMTNGESGFQLKPLPDKVSKVKANVWLGSLFPLVWLCHSARVVFLLKGFSLMYMSTQRWAWWQYGMKRTPSLYVH